MRSITPYVSEKRLVRWYFQPHAAKTTPRPEEPFDKPVSNIRNSIAFTLRFITAIQPPLGHGFKHKGVRTVQRPDGTLTLFWSLLEVRSDTKIPTKTGTRTETVIRYYGFDAGRRLLVETVRSRSREDLYRNSYEWPRVTQLPADVRIKLMEKLLEFRKDMTS